MSERGIEIHNGEVVFPEGMPQTFHLGTAASPLTQGEAGQIVLSAVINAIALGGAVHAGLFSVIASVDLTGGLVALESRAIVDTDVVHTGSLQGLKTQVSILGTVGTSSGPVEGHRIEMYVAAGSDVIGGGVYAIHVTNTFLTAPAFAYRFMRFSEHGIATVRCGIMFYMGPTAGIDYLMELNAGVQVDAWDHIQDPPGAAQGRLVLLVNNVVKYVQLYNA